MASTRRSLLFTFLEKYLITVMQFGAILILARLLTPEEIGVYAVAAGISGMLHALREFGVGQYLICEAELNDDKINGAYGIAITSSTLLGLILLGSSSLVGDFYDSKALSDFMLLSGASIFSVPFGAATLAILQREMRFDAMLTINVTSSLAHVAVSLSMAWQGFGPYSLAFAGVASAFTTVLMARLYRPKWLNPKPAFTGWREIGSFGGLAMIKHIMATTGMRMPEIIIGKVLDFTAAGLFSRAIGMVRLFNQTVFDAVQKVALPSFSRNSRDGHDTSEDYLHGIVMLCSVAWPAFIFISLMAEPMVLVMFGDQWVGSVALVEVMAAASIFHAAFMLFDPYFMAVGHIKKAVLIQAIVQPVSLTLIAVGSTISLLAVAYGYAIFLIFTFFVVSWFVLRITNLSVRQYSIGLLRGLPPLIGTAAGPLLAYELFPADAHFKLLGVAAAGSFVGWMGALLITKHPFIKEIGKFFNAARKK